MGGYGGFWLLAALELAPEQVLDPIELPGRHFQLTSADAWTSQLKVAACGCSEQGLRRVVAHSSCRDAEKIVATCSQRLSAMVFKNNSGKLRQRFRFMSRWHDDAFLFCQLCAGTQSRRHGALSCRRPRSTSSVTGPSFQNTNLVGLEPSRPKPRQHEGRIEAAAAAIAIYVSPPCAPEDDGHGFSAKDAESIDGQSLRCGSEA